MMETGAEHRSTPTLAEATRVWARIGVLSFGGPAAQIALMHREVVDRRGWLTEQQFLNALSFCMFLPGPEAMQLATYSGWRLHGTLGGLIAGLLFVLPGALVILALATIYAYFGSVPLVSALFLGVKATVVLIVVEALLRVAKKALSGMAHWIIAAMAFTGIFFLALPFPLIIAAAAAYGFVMSGSAPSEQPVKIAPSGSLLNTAMTIVLWLAIWFIPLALVAMISPQPVLVEVGVFFSKLAVVTFGGAYAVLAYMGQDVVNQFGWLSAGEMMDGLGLAETTPGPLILVTQFVGFLAAFREGGFGLGVLGALVTLWATFAPCFLWIFAGAPFIDWIGAQPRLKGALSAISAAVVGVILNLTIWFALHVFFARVTATKSGPLVLWTPDLATIDWRAVLLSALCAVLLFRFHWDLMRVLLLASAGGAALVYALG
ncbi:MAG: chromate efflux transporter [Alphaproteobacteria bacterium]|nr:chromate efflux transporter [Alphaproteobacteria bacterium]